MKKCTQKLLEDALISRQALCSRWQVSEETLKRKERAMLLRPIRLSKRMVRYKIAEVLALENSGLAHRISVQAQPDADDSLRTPKGRTPKERLISRCALADRFECSERTLRRYEEEGLLTPMVLDPLKPDQIGYRIAEVVALERKAQGSTPLNENHG